MCIISRYLPGEIVDCGQRLPEFDLLLVVVSLQVLQLLAQVADLVLLLHHDNSVPLSFSRSNQSEISIIPCRPIRSEYYLGS